MPATQLALRLYRPARRRRGILPDLSLIAAPLLRHGNRRGNPNAAPRCGAKTRAKTQCLCPAMRNGRCRMHGGASTGPRTEEGRSRVAQARTKHGRYARGAKARRAAARVHVAQTNSFTSGALALVRLIRSGKRPAMMDLWHFAGSPFLPPMVQAGAVGRGPIWRQKAVHREAGRALGTRTNTDEQ